MLSFYGYTLVRIETEIGKVEVFVSIYVIHYHLKDYMSSKSKTSS